MTIATAAAASTQSVASAATSNSASSHLPPPPTSPSSLPSNSKPQSRREKLWSVIKQYSWQGFLGLLIAILALRVAFKDDRLASWTARKDFRESCLADLARNVTSADCVAAVSKVLPPPPVVKRASAADFSTTKLFLLGVIKQTMPFVFLASMLLLFYDIKNSWLLRRKFQNDGIYQFKISSEEELIRLAVPSIAASLPQQTFKNFASKREFYNKHEDCPLDRGTQPILRQKVFEVVQEVLSALMDDPDHPKHQTFKQITNARRKELIHLVTKSFQDTINAA